MQIDESDGTQKWTWRIHKPVSIKFNRIAGIKKLEYMCGSQATNVFIFKLAAAWVANSLQKRLTFGEL